MGGDRGFGALAFCSFPTGWDKELRECLFSWARCLKVDKCLGAIGTKFPINCTRGRGNVLAVPRMRKRLGG